MTTTAIAHISGTASVTAGGALSLTATNTTDATATADGTATSGAAGGVVAVSVVNTTTQAYIDGSATASGSEVNVNATSTTAASTTAKSTDQGRDRQRLVDPDRPDELRRQDQRRARRRGRRLAITDLTRTTQAYIASSGQVAGTTAISVKASSSTTDATTADGSATTGNTGVGVAVAIDHAQATNEASIEGSADLAAPSISVEAMTPGTTNAYGATATAGAGGTNVGVAGAAGAEPGLEPERRDDPLGATVSVSNPNAPRTADVSLTAQNDVTETAAATPSTSGGAKVGVGAALALEHRDEHGRRRPGEHSPVDRGAQPDPEHGSDAAMMTTGTAGAASTSGVSVDPAVSISIANNTTTAEIGTGTTLDLGALSATATHTGSTSTAAGGTAAGTKAAVGAAIALNIANDTTTASTARNISAPSGDVAFTATASGTSSADATASAAGGATDDGSGGGSENGNTVGDVDSQDAQQRASRTPRATPRAPAIPEMMRRRHRPARPTGA